MHWLRDLSIRFKLLAFSLLVSGITLALAFVAFVSYDIGSLRDSLESELLAIGGIVGRNSVASMVFDDQEEAAGTLDSLSIKPYVHSATLYRPDGSEFAARIFAAEPNLIVDRSCVTDPRVDGAPGAAYVVFQDGVPPHANLCKRLLIDGQLAGTLQIVADLGQFNKEIDSYFRIAAGITLVLLLLACLLSWGLQGLISAPILRLIRTMQRVATDRDYKVRVPRQGDDEIGALSACFNEMLARIEQHEASLQAARYEAETANRAKSAFLATMSHELRTPLNAVLGFSEIMVNEAFGPLGSPNYREYARDIFDSGTHLLRVINDVLDLSKVEAGRFEINRCEIDVEDTIEASLRFVRERGKRAGLTVIGQVEPGLSTLFADERLVRQCLLNLLSNAIKFTPAGGTVIASARADADGWTAFSVADNGIGIAEADIPKVLTPFSQADNAYARKQEGTGLGLPLVKSFVELHGGTFAIKSALGVGTTVILRFPPRPAEAEGHADTPADAATVAAVA
jgi:signal transduction histidine kinase